MRSARKECCFIETRDIKILKKIIMYCDRVQTNLERFNCDYETFNRIICCRMPAVCALFKLESLQESCLMKQKPCQKKYLGD